MKRDLLSIAVVMWLAIFWVVPVNGDDDPVEPSFESIEVVVEYEAEDLTIDSPDPQFPPNSNEIIGTLYSSPIFEQDSDEDKTVIYIVDIDTNGIEAPVLNSGPIDPNQTDDNGGIDPIQ